MTTYVDEFRVWAPTSVRCFKAGSSHLTADSVRELHWFAGRIGLRREWFQDGSTPHYDLTEKRRAAALREGAIFMPAMKQARRRRDLLKEKSDG